MKITARCLPFEGRDVRRALDAIEAINGNFDAPGTGVAFTLPVADVRGLNKNY